MELIPKNVSRLLPTDIVYQTLFWGKVKRKLGWNPLAFDITSRSRSTGDLLVLTKNVADGIPIAYVPQGPEQTPHPEQYGVFLETLSSALSEHLDPQTAFIRYDLPWPDQYDQALNGETSGKDGLSARPEPRLRELRMNFGTRSWNLKKTARDFTVADTLIVDLDGSEDEILARMKSKTRYNIRLAGRKGVRVVQATAEMLPVFYDLHLQTAERNGFRPCRYRRFAALFAARETPPASPEIVFLLAGHGQDILAGAIVTLSGATATFLFGASANHSRDRMPSYAVQWQAIRLAIARGCSFYDMGAVSTANDPTHPFYGMYRFKTGFGGRIVHKAGSWDYPLIDEAYEQFRTFETMGQMLGY